MQKQRAHTGAYLEMEDGTNAVVYKQQVNTKGSENEVTASALSIIACIFRTSIAGLAMNSVTRSQSKPHHSESWDRPHACKVGKIRRTLPDCIALERNRFCLLRC